MAIAPNCDYPTTSGALAMGNLQAQIDGLEQKAGAGGLAVDGHAELIELISLRGCVLARIADMELAEDRAEQLTRRAPASGVAFLTRARARAGFHRFVDALADLDEAQRFGLDPTQVEQERATIFQATGRYDWALRIFRKAARLRDDFESLTALATLYAERGDIATAEGLFSQSRDRYRGVSPFPVAMVDFRRGVMWLHQGDLHRARIWFSAAHRRLPAYAPAQGHLAEVEAALGEPQAAVFLLRPLAAASDDPDYASSLARILSGMGCAEEAQTWQVNAATRYNELVARHLAAFADHAAEFWLDAGMDPIRALWLARRNLEVRRTPRAQALLARAIRAMESPGN